jgi:hypothetical protein
MLDPDVPDFACALSTFYVRAPSLIHVFRVNNTKKKNIYIKDGGVLFTGKGPKLKIACQQ